VIDHLSAGRAHPGRHRREPPMTALAVIATLILLESMHHRGAFRIHI
jgi:hypothetical protein